MKNQPVHSARKTRVLPSRTGHLSRAGVARPAGAAVGARFCAIGVDIGGTKTSAGIVTFPKGEVPASRQIPTAPARGPQALLADVFNLCRELTEAAQRLQQEIGGIGVGICELVDREGNLASENCIHWQRVPVRKRLSRLAPTVLEADVRAAALAEAMFGAGKQFRQFLYVTVGTGISCCLMLDGEPFTGAHGATGTMASSPLSVPCEQCGHVSRRSLEEIASGPALVTRYYQQSTGPFNGGETVVAAAVRGDAEAEFVVRSGAEALGATIGWLVNVLDPEAVVIGGGLGLSEGPFWESLVVSTRRHIWSKACRNLPIARAVTGTKAGFIGAAAAAWHQFRRSEFQKVSSACTH